MAAVSVHDIFRFQICVHQAVQYHRAMPEHQQNPKFYDWADPFIQHFEPRIGKGGEITDTLLSEHIEPSADKLSAYIDRFSGKEAYKFRCLCGAAAHYFKIIAPALTQKALSDIEPMVEQEIHALRNRGYKTARLRKEADLVRQRYVKKYVLAFGRMLQKLSAQTADVKSLVNFCESNLQSTF